MKNTIFTVVCVLLALTLVLTIIGFRGVIAKNEEAHDAEMSSLAESFSREIKSLESAIGDVKKQNASLFREILYEYKDANAETGKARLHVTVCPKDVSETMTVEVGFEGQGMVPMQRHEGMFFLNLEVDIFGEYGAVYLNVRGEDVATGLEKTDIPTKDIYKRFLPTPHVYFTGEPKLVDGNLSLYGGFSHGTYGYHKTYDTEGDIENVIIYVKKNGKVVERIYESDGGDKTHGCPVEEGDVVSLFARVRDSYGFVREYIFGQYAIDPQFWNGFADLNTYFLDENGKPYRHHYETVLGSTDALLYDFVSPSAFPLTVK